MTTITVEVPFVVKSNHYMWDEFARILWQYKQDQEDISLVQGEMKKEQNSVSLETYLTKVGHK